MFVQNDHFKKLLLIQSGVSNFEHEDLVIPMLCMFDKLVIDTILPAKVTFKTHEILDKDELSSLIDFFNLKRSMVNIGAFQIVFLEKRYTTSSTLKINITNDGQAKISLFKYTFNNEVLTLKTTFD